MTTVVPSRPAPAAKVAKAATQRWSSVTLGTASPPLRIAFTGKMGAGKSTHAHLLRERFKGDVLSFAGPLKKITKEMFSDRMQDVAFARSANQQVGVLARQLAGPNIWVEKLLARVPLDRNCFVDDCRFLSEVRALQARGFRVVRLAAAQETLYERRPDVTPEQWQHESETALTLVQLDATFYTDVNDIETTQAEIRAWVLQDLQDLRQQKPSEY